jgi:hypothetical protein
VILMARAHYYVVHHQNEWKISFENKHYGPYATQAAAIRAAVDTAREAGKQGHDAQVLVQGVNNQFRHRMDVWTRSIPAARLIFRARLPRVSPDHARAQAQNRDRSAAEMAETRPW